MTTWEVGQTATITIELDTHGGDTELALAVTSPSGVESAPSASHDADRSTWTATLLVDEAGDWAAVATVTGTGRTEVSQTLHVAPQPPPSTGAYATTADWAAWFGAPPDGIALTLRLAELDVKGKIRSAIYDVDVHDLPSDATQRQAVRDATVLQAKHRKDTGRATGTSGGSGNFSIGKISAGPRDPSKIFGGMPGDPSFSNDAWQILVDAGLTGFGPQPW